MLAASAFRFDQRFLRAVKPNENLSSRLYDPNFDHGIIPRKPLASPSPRRLRTYTRSPRFCGAARLNCPWNFAAVSRLCRDFRETFVKNRSLFLAWWWRRVTRSFAEEILKSWRGDGFLLRVNVKLQVEWDTIVGNGIRPNQSNCFFLFFPFFFCTLLARNFSFESHLRRKISILWTDKFVNIYIYLFFKQHFIRNTKVFVSYIFSTSV